MTKRRPQRFNHQTERLLREPQRCEVTGIPQQTWYDLQKEGLAPPPVRIGRAAVYPESELAALNAARIAAKSDEEIRALVKRFVAKRKQALRPFET